MIKHITRFWIVLTLAGIVLLAFAATGMGQCAMCRASLAGSGNAHFIRNFNIGVLVLLVPPVAMFCSIFWALRRYRGVAEDANVQDDNSAD